MRQRHRKSGNKHPTKPNFASASASKSLAPKLPKIWPATTRDALITVLERNLAKKLGFVNHIDPKFTPVSGDNFVERVRASVAAFRGLKHPPKNFNFGILVVFDAHLTGTGQVIKGPRKNVFLQSKGNPSEIDILNIVEHSNGSISLERAPTKAKSYILPSAAQFAQAAMNKK